MRRNIPSLQALSCFDAAARHDSYTRAAEELAMTQGAVSRQIAALERFLGLALFRRTRHGVALTPAGSAYARQVRQQLDTLERHTLDAMANQGQGGAVHLATVPTFASRWLMPRLPALRATHPELVLHIDIRTRPFLFAETPFDAAVAAGTPEELMRWPGTRRAALLPEEMIVVGAPSWLPARRKALTAADVAALPLLQASTRPEAWRDWFDAHGHAAEAAVAGPRYELFSMLAAAAVQGQGVALLPRLLVQDELTAGQLVELCQSAASAPRTVALITPEGRADSPALASFRAWLMSQAEAGATTS